MLVLLHFPRRHSFPFHHISFEISLMTFCLKTFGRQFVPSLCQGQCREGLPGGQCTPAPVGGLVDPLRHTKFASAWHCGHQEKVLMPSLSTWHFSFASLHITVCVPRPLLVMVLGFLLTVLFLLGAGLSLVPSCISGATCLTGYSCSSWPQGPFFLLPLYINICNTDTTFSGVCE